MDGDANGLFRQTKGTFQDVAEAVGVAWGGRTAGDKANGTVRPCVADVDNDGHLDLFFANYGKNGLFLNRGNGTFANVSPVWEIAIDARYDSCAFGDMDNDGDLDLYVNGTITGGQQYRDYLFLNSGSKYEDVTPAEIGSPHGDHGVQWADYDLNGALDLAVTGGQKDGMHWLLRNPLADPVRTRGINVRVLDADGRATLSGAEISVVSGSGRRQKRLVDAGSGYNAQNDMPVHLAVAGSAAVTLELRVPSPRHVSVSTSAPIDLRKWGGRVYEMRMPRISSKP